MIARHLSAATLEQRRDCNRAEKGRHEPPEQWAERQHSARFQTIPVGQQQLIRAKAEETGGQKRIHERTDELRVRLPHGVERIAVAKGR